MALTIIYNSADGSGFLLKNVPSTEQGSSIGGYALLTPTYLEQNKLYGKPIEVIHSWNSTGPVFEATFTIPRHDPNRLNKNGEPEPANVGKYITYGKIYGGMEIYDYHEDFC